MAETVPKEYGREKADWVIYGIAPLLRLLYQLTSGIANGLVVLSEQILRPFGWVEKKSPFVTREEFFSLMEEGARRGVMEEDKKRLIDVILNFHEVRVKEVMTPLAEVPKVNIAARVREVKEMARRIPSNYFVVYEEIPTLVVGVVFVYDLLFEENEEGTLRDYLRSPVFLPGETSAEVAFLKLQENRQSLATVLDEKREVIGVVQIEDLIGL